MFFELRFAQLLTTERVPPNKILSLSECYEGRLKTGPHFHMLFFFKFSTKCRQYPTLNWAENITETV